MKLNTHKIDIMLARKGMTKTSLAAEAGMSRQFLNTILTRGSCTPINAGKIAAGLAVDVAEIVKEG